MVDNAVDEDPIRELDLEQIHEEARRRDPDGYRARLQAEELVLRDLAAAGFEAESLGNLMYRYKEYKAAIPILLRWLPRTKNPDIKGAIVDALAVRFAGPEVAPAFIDAFEAQVVRDRADFHVKWAIGDALRVVGDDRIFDDIVRLSLDRRHGKARGMLLVALGNMKNRRAVDVLLELLDDDEVQTFVLEPLGKLRAKKARPKVEPFAIHPDPWVRNQAERALKKIGPAEPEVEQERLRARRAAEAPLLRELAATGFPVARVDELRRGYKRYEAAITILARWLPRIDHPEVRYGIVRSLGVRFARPEAAPSLLEAFEAQPTTDRYTQYLKWWIGEALSITADDSVFDGVLRLARDRHHGWMRAKVVEALANMKQHREDVIDVLIELLDDTDVRVGAAVALGKLRAARARPHLERLQHDADDVLRVEVAYALNRMPEPKNAKSRAKRLT